MHQFVRHRSSYRVAYALGLGAMCAALAGCVTNDNVASRSDAARDVAAAPSSGQMATAAARPRAAAKHAAASTDKTGYSAVGLASWSGADFHGRATADGEAFDMHSLTAAHRTLPMHCMVRVTNLANHRSLLVRVNDRGPYVGNRLIDLSARSAQLLGFYDRGLAKVKVDYVGPTQRPAQPRVADAAPM